MGSSLQNPPEIEYTRDGYSYKPITGHPGFFLVYAKNSKFLTDARNEICKKVICNVTPVPGVVAIIERTEK